MVAGLNRESSGDDGDMANPVVHWMPPRFVTSAWVEHTPFAYWLMQAARPRLLVELGTHNGFSFFVFAEAAKRLSLDTELFALDSWQGDDQAGFYGNEVYESVSAIAEADYDRAQLVRGFFSESVNRFENGSIDVLHLDGRHGYDDVAADFDSYREKLSDRAVVLFHDTFEFREGFGVHEFWADISADRPAFNFEHGHGLGVLAWGLDVPTPVARLIEVANNDVDRVREWFSSLGARVSRQFVLEIDHFELIHELRLEKIASERSLAEKDRELSAEKVTAEELRLELGRMRSTASWRLTSPLRQIRRLGSGAQGSKHHDR